MGNPIRRSLALFLWLTGATLDAKELLVIFGVSGMITAIITAIVDFFRNMPIPLLVIFCICLMVVLFVGISYVYSFIKRKRSVGSKSKSTVGGLVGRLGRGAKILRSHYKGKIIIHGSPENVNAGGVAGQTDENTEIVDSSADAEIEYKQD